MATILLAEDHNLIVDGYKLFISKIEGLEIVDTATNGEEAMEFLRKYKPNFMILDLHMPKANGLEVLKFAHENYPDTNIIVISMFGDSTMHREVVKLGAKGYLLKNADQDEFELALKLVLQGKSYYSPALFEEHTEVQHAPGSMPVVPMVNLTQREKEILALLAQGNTNKDVAKKLFVSPKTIDTHRTNLMKKIGVNNVTGLVKYAIANGYEV